MNFFRKLSSLFTGSVGSHDENSHFITVQCLRCGEIIQSRVNLANDLSLEYGEGEKMTYFCRKVLMGTQRCFQKVEVTLTFDGNRNLIDRQVTDGKFSDS
jgi:hypothetical protein